MWYAWRTIESRTGFCCGNLKEKATLETKGLDGKIILKWAGVDWSNLAQDRDGRRALVKR